MMQTLPLLTPDPRRTARTRARCHDRLTRRRQRLEAARRRANTRYLDVERALVLGFCVIYVSGVVLVAIQMLSGG